MRTFSTLQRLVFWVLILLLCFITSGIDSLKSFNKKNLNVILWWTDLLYPHATKYSEIKCSNSTCISSRKRLYKNDKVKIIYLFYGTDFAIHHLPLPREDNHIWALLHEESPMNNFIFSHTIGIKLFNFTGTFSRESDFPLTTQFIPSIEYLINRKPIPIYEKNKFRKNGTAPILYLQSHCNVASDRDRYVKELMNFVQIDSYGTCLHNKDLPLHLVSTETYSSEELLAFISKYKFHLAFENAICDDYITEKLFRSFHVGSVPIYKGSPLVKDWLPSDKSIIAVNDFKDPSELADFIIKLDQNDNLYQQYLEYKKHGIVNDIIKDNLLNRKWGVNDPNKIDFIQGFECYLCDKIHMMHELSSLAIANKKHMNCPQPHLSLSPEEQIKLKIEWLEQDWIESYWFAYDQAKAIEMMIKNKENSTSNFMKYLQNDKWHN